MNDTVAVALITALSTLFGVGITGLVALRTTGRQVDALERQALRDHAEQRAVRKRELRREVYVRFLDELLELERAMSEAWQEAPPADGESFFRDLFAKVQRLRETSNLLALEGSEAVSLAASVVIGHASDQVFALSSVANEGRSRDIPDALMDFGQDDWEEHVTRFQDAKESFLVRARAVLSGEPSPDV